MSCTEGMPKADNGQIERILSDICTISQKDYSGSYFLSRNRFLLILYIYCITIESITA